MNEVKKLIQDGITTEITGDAQYEFQRAKKFRLFEDTLLNLKEIYLHDCDIDFAGTKILAEALKRNHTITTLSLVNNNIGSEGAKDIAEALIKNNTITTLGVSNNGIGKDGTREIVEALKINTSITTLNLVGNAIGYEGAKTIAEILKNNTSITSLNLNNNAIGKAGAKAIAESLKTNTFITSLNLSFNAIGNEGAKYIAESLKTNTFITLLDLYFNAIHDKGTKAIAEALKINTSITKLNLGYYDVVNENAININIIITKNKQLAESLIEAAINNDAQKAIEALKKGANVNHQDDYGDTALHHAINQANHTIIKFLIELPHQHIHLQNNIGITSADSHLLPRGSFNFGEHGIKFFSRRLISDVSKQGPTAPDVTFKFKS